MQYFSPKTMDLVGSPLRAGTDNVATSTSESDLNTLASGTTGDPMFTLPYAQALGAYGYEMPGPRAT
jgi:hypothetical protein